METEFKFSVFYEVDEIYLGQTNTRNTLKLLTNISDIISFISSNVITHTLNYYYIKYQSEWVEGLTVYVQLYYDILRLVLLDILSLLSPWLHYYS